MIVSNTALQQVCRGVYQAVEHLLLCTVLVNTYLLSLCNNIEGPWSISFRYFRIQLISALLYKTKSLDPSRKRTISYISYDVINVLVRQYKMIKRSTRKDCISFKGLRIKDRPIKRVALSIPSSVASCRTLARAKLVQTLHWPIGSLRPSLCYFMPKIQGFSNLYPIVRPLLACDSSPRARG